MLSSTVETDLVFRNYWVPYRMGNKKKKKKKDKAPPGRIASNAQDIFTELVISVLMSER